MLTRKLSINATKFSAALFSGFLLGAIAGLLGVGGGEFRIPILLHVLGLSVITAIAVNLLVGFLTVVASFLRRFQLGLFNEKTLDIALTMSFGSIIGAYLGASLTDKVSEKPLKKVLAVLLIVVGLKIGLEPFIHVPFLSFSFTIDLWLEMILALSIGILIGIVSGALGVAGGEFRIPALIYLFGLDIVIAGTVSLLVSIPTVGAGFLKHYRMNHADSEAHMIAAMMSFGSILGAFIGASYAGVIEKDVLKMLLGAILIAATIRMVTKP